MRMQPPGSDTPYDGTRLKKFLSVDKHTLDKMMKKKLQNRLA